jgi:hypothetical protein
MRAHTTIATAVLVLLLGCGALRGPAVDPDEHVRGELTRVIREPADTLWPALVNALDGEGLAVAHAERNRGILTTRPARYAERDVAKRLAQIGDLSALRRSGIGRVVELLVAYHLILRPAEEGSTRLTIRATIEAIDRSELVALGPGMLEVIPRRIPVPSRGVVERELLRRLGATLFTAEEMLFLLGEPGVD